MVMNFEAPSPSRAMACASVSITSAMASSTLGISLGSGRTPEAPLASSTQRVVGGGVAIHRDAVVAALHRRASAWPAERGSGMCASVITKPRVVAMLRLNHAGAFGQPGHAHGAAAQAEFGEGGFRHQVRGQDGVARHPRSARVRPATSRGSASRSCAHPVPRQSRRWRPAAPAPAAASAIWPRRAQVASATASPVRVAQLALPAFIRMAPTSPLRHASNARAAQPHRRRLHAVLREHGGGVGRQTADDQGQIVLLGLAYAGVGGGIQISKRQVQRALS